MVNIVVAGLGPVGIAASTALKNHPSVTVYEDDPYKGVDFPNDMVPIVDAVVVKSTTEPTFFSRYDHLDLTFSPEYLRGTTGASPTEEFLNSEFAVYGGGSMRWWHEIFKVVLPKLKDVRFMTAEQAAFAKYFLNCFLATKVTFFNQAFEIFKACGGEDFDVVIDGLCLDPRVGHSHTQVPGPDGQFGYGGHCFPKDMAALLSAGELWGANVDFLKATIDANDTYRKKLPD
jgi:UDP-glucose 6-dehydrogenase